MISDAALLNDDWLRVFTTFSRTGYVTPGIEACEEQWATQYFGNVAAAEAIRDLPAYAAYAGELRRVLKFPLVLYRVCEAPVFERWRAAPFSRPVAASLSLTIAEAFWQLRCAEEHAILLEARIRDPEAVIMRGRVKGCELVIDSGRIDPAEIRLRHVPGEGDAPAGP